MAGFQQTIIIGNVGSDVSMRYTQSGVAVCSFSVAVTERWTKDGVKQEKTNWYKISAWRGLAETCNEYVHKGMQIQVVGVTEASAYLNRDNQPAASLELTASSVMFLGSRDTGDGKTDEERRMSDQPF